MPSGWAATAGPVVSYALKSWTMSGREASGIGDRSFAFEQQSLDPRRQELARRVERVASRTMDLRLRAARVRREQQDAVADADGFGNRMRDEQHRELDLLPEPQQLFLHPAARERVERGE